MTLTHQHVRAVTVFVLDPVQHQNPCQAVTRSPLASLRSWSWSFSPCRLWGCSRCRMSCATLPSSPVLSVCLLQSLVCTAPAPRFDQDRGQRCHHLYHRRRNVKSPFDHTQFPERWSKHGSHHGFLCRTEQKNVQCRDGNDVCGSVFDHMAHAHTCSTSKTTPMFCQPFALLVGS